MKQKKKLWEKLGTWYNIILGAMALSLIYPMFNNGINGLKIWGVCAIFMMLVLLTLITKIIKLKNKDTEYLINEAKKELDRAEVNCIFYKEELKRLQTK